MSDGTPARLDRAALERVIQRAAELQTAERETGDSLSSDEIMALGREVGIPGRYLQQALLEERTRVAGVAPGGLWQRLAGPPHATAQRVIRGEPEVVERTLIAWVEQHEMLAVLRQQPGRITWEPITGFQAAIRYSTSVFGGGKRPFMLSRADSVSATILGLEPGWSHVALTATARKVRGSFVGTGAGFATAGVAGSAVMIVLGALFPISLIPIPLGLGLGYSIARRYGPALERIQLGLERALDHLEQAAPGAGNQLPPRTAGLLDLLASEVRKALK